MSDVLLGVGVILQIVAALFIACGFLVRWIWQ